MRMALYPHYPHFTVYLFARYRNIFHSPSTEAREKTSNPGMPADGTEENKMMRWVLHCPGCDRVLIHSEISESDSWGIDPYTNLTKPNFPNGGLNVLLPKLQGHVRLSKTSARLSKILTLFEKINLLGRSGFWRDTIPPRFATKRAMIGDSLENSGRINLP